MKKRVICLVLIVISMFLIAGCVEVDNVDELKKEGEELVCLPGEEDTTTDEGVIDTEDDEEIPETEEEETEDGITEELKDEIDDVTEDETLIEETDDVTEEVEDVVEEAEEDGMIVKTFTEGDIVTLVPKATDQDNDEVTFTFTSPLDTSGKWQTSEGDAGTYIITITASDGKSEVSKKVKVVVKSMNQAPTLGINQEVIVKEGDTVTLNPAVSDPDGDEVSVEFSGWMTSDTKTTNYDDEGSYEVVVTVSDNQLSISKSVIIEVQNVNRPPVLNKVQDVEVTEGELVEVIAKALDADNDVVTYTYIGAPIENGEWQTVEGDAGNYKIKVIASDGKNEDEKTFDLIVNMKNQAPVISPMDDILITVEPGQTKTVTLSPVISDPEGDDLVVTFSGWMTTATKDVTFDDGGAHTVTVTADDGKLETSVDVTVDINRPPEFIVE